VTTLSADSLRVRRTIYERFVAGDVPRLAEVADALRLPVEAVRAHYEQLSDAHVLVLDPDSREVWMAMPFSARPTPFHVQGPRASWHANCAWDAFGIPAALACGVTITTTCPGCETPLTYDADGQSLYRGAGVVLFSVPATRWWDDIGFT